MTKIIALRAHTEFAAEPNKQTNEQNQRPRPTKPEKWPDVVLVFDCETRIDEKQCLTFGVYRVVGRSSGGNYDDVREEGFFYDPNEISTSELRQLQNFAAENRAETAKDVKDKLHVRTRKDFVERVFFPLAVGGALVVAFNLPFDVSRIATDARPARRLTEDWSFVMTEEGYLPRIIVTRKDGRIAFFRISGVRWDEEKEKFVRLPDGRFLDVRTLAWALRNVSYSLKSLCKELKIRGKLKHEPTGNVTLKEILYARQDVRATLSALNALRVEFNDFPVDLKPEQAYSPASIVKAYLETMGVTPPSEKFQPSPRMHGIAAQAFYGGRAECRIRRTALPVVHTDFKSEYPTVITLMGLWRLITAKQIRIKEATSEVRNILQQVDLDRTFDPMFWHSLNCFVLVQPSNDVLPIRTAYESNTGNNVGVNFLTSDKPLWFALPDVISSKILTGKPPRIIRAIRVVGQGQQSGLKSTSLGNTRIDPRADFFKIVIETRERVKQDTTLPEDRRKALGYFLKILANAGYGIFIETTPEPVSGRKQADVFSGEIAFRTSSPFVENKRDWYCPLVASLITAAGRLFLAMLECCVVGERGGNYLFADTDSMAIVATENGGVLPCVGGSEHMSDGRDGIKALSWVEVDDIAAQFNRLNLYDRDAVPKILKVEDVNFGKKRRRQINGYAISAKRYTFFIRRRKNITVITPSEHGLGHIFLPNAKFDETQGAKTWVIKVWRFLLGSALGLKIRKAKFFTLPAMMRFAITTSEVLKILQKRQLDKKQSYSDRIKPFNFILSPMINNQVVASDSRTEKTLKIGYPVFVDPDRFTLIAPFTEDVRRWYESPWVNIHDGRLFYLAPLDRKQSFEAAPYSLDDLIDLYHAHPEYKSLAPDGTACGANTSGILLRTSIVATEFTYIGKETDRKWEHEEDVSMLFPLLPMYRSDETDRLVRDSSIQDRVRARSIRRMSSKTGLSTRTIRAYRDGKRIRKATLRRLEKAIMELEIEELSRREEGLGLKSA